MNAFNNLFVHSGYELAQKGMTLVRPIELQPSQVLYRFYDSKRSASPEAGADGPWWIEFEHFQTIRHFALRNDYAFSYAARLFLAILYEWSEVDAFVKCEVTKPLNAWKGRGKQVGSEGRDARDLPKMTPMQSVLEIYQIYIPGIGGPTSIGKATLRVTGSDAI